MNESKAKQHISSLKSELAFYKEEYQKFKHQEFEYEDVKEELELLKEKYAAEKTKMQEEINWLKACINEQKTQAESSSKHDYLNKESIRNLRHRVSEGAESRMEEKAVARKSTRNTDLFLSMQRKMDK